ncbi:MAG: hypothetical protein ACE5GM_07115 [bacterium]
MKFRICLAVSLLFIGFTDASAHKLILDLDQLKDGRVLATGYFPDGTPSAATPIDIYSGEKKIMTGKSDANGEWVFTLPSHVSRIRGVLLGELGHRAESDVLVLSTAVSQRKGASETVDRPHRHHIRKEKFPLKNVLVGLAFIFVLGSLARHYTKK